jgi:magnesium transporter
MQVMSETVGQRSQKIGLSPGTLIIPKGTRPQKAKINLIQYNANSHQIHKDKSLSEVLTLMDRQYINWIQVEGIEDVELISEIGAHFKIHPLFLEDIANTEQRPKLEELENIIYVSTRIIRLNEEEICLNEESLSLLLLNNTLISFIETDNDLFAPIFARIQKEQSRTRLRKEDYLL